MNGLLPLALAMMTGVGNPAVSLEVDVSTLPEDEVTHALVSHIVAEGTQTLEAGGIDVLDDAGATVTVTVTRYGEHDVHYRTTVSLADGDDQVERTVDCEVCLDSELVDQIGKEIARLSGRVLYGGPQDHEEPEPAASDDVEPEPTEASSEDTAPSKRLGPMGKAGIGVMVGGVASVAVGVPLVLTADTARIGEMGVEERATRPTGLALIGVGATMAATGVVLVVLDVVRRKKAGRVSLSPVVMPSQVTFSMGVKF